MELNDGHGDGMTKNSEDQVLKLGKEEREKQKSMEIKAKVLIEIFVSPIKTPSGADLLPKPLGPRPKSFAQ